jgi:hypothetical protein
MEILDIQKQLFQVIKSRLPAEASMPEEIAKLLQISSDSAYRRMRGEKLITFEELYLLCSQYRISLDQLMDIQTGAYMFQGNLLNAKNFRFDAYLTGMMHNIAYFASFKQKEYYYLCKDAPIFHHWQNKEFAAFKYYFWMSTLLGFPDFRNKKVSLDYPAELWELGQKILDRYNQMDSFEIWNIESLNTTLHQIEYYRDGNMFESDSDVLRIYEGIETTMNHLEEQARLGYKYQLGDSEKKPLGRYNLYLNEILILDNNMMVVLDNTKMSLVPHSVINYMMTRDTAFCENFYQYIQNLLKRSTLISEVSEKERSRFFRILRERIARRKEALAV